MAAPATTQEAVDQFYLRNGPCCAGCDFWRYFNAVAGECTRYPPNKRHDAGATLGIYGSSLGPTSTAITLRDHWCGEFRDDPAGWTNLRKPSQRTFREAVAAERKRPAPTGDAG